MYEVELRGLLSKEKYMQLNALLKVVSFKYSPDNKTAYFYSFDNGILKVVHEISNNIIKLSLKTGDEYSGKGMKEVEVALGSINDMYSCMSTLSAMGYKQKAIINQKRINYLYDGVSISLKHTPSWSYHFEAEILVSQKKYITNARKKILRVCELLDIHPLSSEELKQFIENLDSK